MRWHTARVWGLRQSRVFNSPLGCGYGLAAVPLRRGGNLKSGLVCNGCAASANSFTVRSVRWGHGAADASGPGHVSVEAGESAAAGGEGGREG